MSIIEKITCLRQQRDWSEYQLAERAGLPQSTISSWYRKGMVPTLASLQKIADAFGITLSQLVALEGDPVSLTPRQQELLQKWNRLSEEQKEILLKFIDTI
ncbi:MAG: helix-turn-helix domain-containing protein [Oscillospiraceae bacterium]